MKKLLAIAATLAASSAFAGVKLEVRSDYVNTPDYDSYLAANQASTSIGGSSVFAPSVARLYLNGNVGEAIVESAWNLRSFTPEFSVNPYTGTNDLSKTMTADQFVEHLWAGKAMGQWMFKAGKLEVNTGGFERQKNLHGDTYLVSMANGGVGGARPAGLPATPYFDQLDANVANPENSSGISAAYSINENHKLEVQVTNQVNSGTWKSYGSAGTAGTNVRSADKGHTYGLNYLGSFMDKMLVLNANYTVGSADTTAIGQAGVSHGLEFMSAGLRVAPMSDLTIDLEYFANKDKVDTGAAASSGDNKTTSTIVEARYNINGWVPVVKYEMSENKTLAGNSINDFKRDAWAAGVEFVPKADEAFRYHVAYTSIKDKDFGVTAPDVTKNMIVVGFKYMGDMAK